MTETSDDTLLKLLESIIEKSQEYIVANRSHRDKVKEYIVSKEGTFSQLIRSCNMRFQIIKDPEKKKVFLKLFEKVGAYVASSKMLLNPEVYDNAIINMNGLYEEIIKSLDEYKSIK